MDRTGISERRIVDKGTPTSELAAEASVRLLNDRGISAEEIDLIIVATVTPDMLFPFHCVRSAGTDRRHQRVGI